MVAAVVGREDAEQKFNGLVCSIYDDQFPGVMVPD